MPPEAATHLFNLLCELLPTGATEATVRQRLKPLTTATSLVRNQLGRTYLTLGGEFFQLTAIFEGAARHLYQVTLRATPPAYMAIKTFARTLPETADLPPALTAEWRASWLGFVPQLLLRPTNGTANGVSVRFVGLLPTKKVIILTRL
jgi:hypothetical protein